VQSPILTIVAGCNGSGKSTYSRAYVDNVIPFDYDKRYLEIYRSLPDSELREKFAKNKTTEEFSSAFNKALFIKEDFCFETNFDNYPRYHALRARKAGFKVHIHFYCLRNIFLAKKRVATRTANKGHYINDETVEYKWKVGYKNLNLHYKLFDYILLMDNSKHMDIPKVLFSLTKNKDGSYFKSVSSIPSYAKTRFPNIYSLLV
jgi:predicted ABC-type ATPase